MIGEDSFRIALLAVIAGAAAVAVSHRRRAASSNEPICRADEGYWMAISLRLGGLTLWLSTLAYLLAPASVQFASLPLPTPLRWSAVVVALASVWLMHWTLSKLGKNLTDTVVTRREASLVTDGPYRWVRHPYYVVSALLMGSVTLLTANALIGAASLLVLVLLAIRTPNEERHLIERFGDSYRQYMRQTGRFWPRW